MTAKPTGVYAKVVAIMAEIGPVEKTGYNSFHKYKYLKEEDIINAVRPLLAKHGVALVPQVIAEDISELRSTGRGGELRTETLCRLRVEFTFVDTATGDSFSVITVGHGVDPGDKAAYKAMTGALKYCLRQLFMISEGGEDPEADVSTDERSANRGRRQTPDTYGMDTSQAADHTISITPSAVANVGRGGRTPNANDAQVNALRQIAKRYRLGPVDLAAMIVAITGDVIAIEDSMDGPTAAMALQNYLNAAKSETLAQIIVGVQDAMANPEDAPAPMEEPDYDYPIPRITP